MTSSLTVVFDHDLLLTGDGYPSDIVTTSHTLSNTQVVQCIWKVFRPLDFFHIFVTLQHYSKMKNFFFFFSLHTIPYKDKAIFANWNYIYISIKTLYSVLCWSTLAAFTASSLHGYDAASLAHLYFKGFSILLFRYSQSLSGWMGSIAAQRFSDLSRDVRHSRTFRDLSLSHSCIVLAVYLGLLSCWKVNLHTESEVLTTLEQVFTKDLSLLCIIYLFLNPD